MNWTKEPPEIRGYYWYYAPLSKTIQMLFVRYSDISKMWIANNHYNTKNLNGYWLGPLPMPEKPED